MGKTILHDDVIKWKHLRRYWPLVRGIHRSSVNSPHKGQWRGALMFFMICVWINGWVNNRGTGDLRRYCAYYDFTVMLLGCKPHLKNAVEKNKTPPCSFHCRTQSYKYSICPKLVYVLILSWMNVSYANDVNGANVHCWDKYRWLSAWLQYLHC